MAYTPSEWSCGDIVTADKLNNIERGIAEVNSEYVPTSWQCGDLITAEAMNKIEQGIANAGGGSSDFSTAEVTIVNNKTLLVAPNTIAVAYVTDEYMYPAFVSRPLTSATISAVLYKGVAHIDISSLLESSEINVSGNAEIITEESYTLIVVTGDCTITISGVK